MGMESGQADSEGKERPVVARGKGASGKMLDLSFPGGRLVILCVFLLFHAAPQQFSSTPKGKARKLLAAEEEKYERKDTNKIETPSTVETRTHIITFSLLFSITFQSLTPHITFPLAPRPSVPPFPCPAGGGSDQAQLARVMEAGDRR